MAASTFSSIGYVHALKGDLIEAVEAFHKALGIRRDDTFSTTMLNQVMESMLQEEPPYAGKFEASILQQKLPISEWKHEPRNSQQILHLFKTKIRL